MTKYQVLSNNLTKLKLNHFAEHLDHLLDHQEDEPKSLIDALYELTTAELKYT